jgi:hypothetical protein
MRLLIKRVNKADSVDEEAGAKVCRLPHRGDRRMEYEPLGLSLMVKLEFNDKWGFLIKSFNLYGKMLLMTHAWWADLY